MIRSPEPIRTIRVIASPLKQNNGAAELPATHIAVRYAVSGGRGPHGSAARHPAGATYLGILEETPPKTIPVPEGHNGVSLPVWITCHVPKGSKNGVYQGTVSVKINDLPNAVAAVTLTVAGYSLPDTTEYASYGNLMQSPESVALAYQVPLWSERHWQLLDKTFRMLGRVGDKVVFVPLIARTNMGNAYSMVRWIRSGDGWKHDFSIAEKYLDLARKHLGTNAIVCLYAWTPTHGGGGFGKLVDKDKNDMPLYVTVLDPKTGKITPTEGPDWGSAESVPFWKPVFDGIRTRLDDRNLNRRALGLMCDRVPSKQCISDLAVVAPELGWMVHSHGSYTRFAEKPIILGARVWGIKGPYRSTDRVHSRYTRFAWKNPYPITVFPRYGAGAMGHVSVASSIGLFHGLMEGYSASGYNGLSRVGADLWPCIKDKRGRKRTILGRFPTWQRPGAPTKTVSAFLHPGKNGPVATQQFEVLRLGMQECETRIDMERILQDKTMRDKLDNDLVGRIQSVLDDRVQAIMDAKKGGGQLNSTGSDASWMDYVRGVPERTAKLYQVASELQKTKTSAR